MKTKLFNHAKWNHISRTTSFYNQWTYFLWTVHLKWKIFSFCSSFSLLWLLKAHLKTNISPHPVLLQPPLGFHFYLLPLNSLLLFLLRFVFLYGFPFSKGNHYFVWSIHSNIAKSFTLETSSSARKTRVW